MENEPVILHLNINPEDCDEAPTAIPQAYDTDSDTFMKVEEKKSTEYDDLPDIGIFTKNEDHKIHRMLQNTFNKEKPHAWPQKTTIACWHCCHEFSNRPVALPMRYMKSNYHVFGCFCSFNCAMAYNLSQKDNMIFERESLLKKMASNMVGSRAKFLSMKPSPPKEILKRFGGILSIEDYRKNLTVPEKDFWMVNPPVVVMIPHIEEIRTQQLNMLNRSNESKNDFIPLDMKAVERATKKLNKKKMTIRSNNCLEITMGIRQDDR